MWFIKLINNVVFQTVISGVLVFVIGEIAQKFFLQPLQDFKSVIGKTDHYLKFYANVIVSFAHPTEVAIKVADALRTLSCDLEVAYKKLPSNLLFLVPSKEAITSAARSLIYLSNSVGKQGEAVRNDEQIRIIRNNLKIPEL